MKRLSFGLVSIFISLACFGCKQSPNADSKKEDATSEVLKISSEDYENALVRALGISTLPLSDEMQGVLENAKNGDDAAKEKLGMFYLKQPRTRETHNEAARWLKSVKKHSDPEATLQRGLVDFLSPLSLYSKDIHDTGVRHIQDAARLGHIEALKMTLKYPEMRMHSFDAVAKLDEIFEAKTADNREPADLYAWAMAIKDGKNTDERVASLILESVEGNDPEAKIQSAISLLDNIDIRDGVWTKVVGVVKNAAAQGHIDACHAMIRLFSRYKSSPEAFSPDRKLYMSTTVAQSLKSVDELIYDYAMLATGTDEGCQAMLSVLGLSDESHEAYFVCLRKWIDKNPVRSICDAIMRDIPWEPMKSDKKINDKDLANVGLLLLKCYQSALLRGDDYPAEAGVAGVSTASELAGLYDGNSLFLIAPDFDKKMTYLVYAAQNGEWQAQWLLSNEYTKEGKLQDLQRGCYWADKSYHTRFCHEICKENVEARRADKTVSLIPGCDTCEDAKKYYRKCSKGDTGKE